MDKFTELEKWTDHRLKLLPLKEAPPPLILDVLARLNERRKLAWWKKTFWEWTSGQKLMAIPVALGGAFLTGYLAFLVWKLELLSRLISLMQEVLRPFSLLGEFLLALITSMFSIARSMDQIWLYGSLAVLAVLYVTSIGLGSYLLHFQWAKKTSQS